MSQPFANFSRAVGITKSDTVNFDASISTSGAAVAPCDAIWVGGAGIVVAIMQDGSAPQFTCVAGSLLPIRAIRVNSTTTTATLMVALYQV
jgi:hypothetical protein